MSNLTKSKPVTKLQTTKNNGTKQMLLVADTFTPRPKDGAEVWIRDFIKLKSCSRQGVYEMVKQGSLNAIRKYGTMFIIWDAEAKNWFPKVLNVKE